MFQFKGYTLDTRRSALRAADQEVELRPKAFEVLRYLVENAERLVSKDELIKAIWPDVTATDESLAHCVSEVRRALGDGEQTIIKTVPRRGYRFAAQVDRLEFNDASEQKSPLATGPARSGTGLQRELLLPDRPSIAVLPFHNMSGDVEQEYFADGVVEDIITALSRFSSLFVIARNSSFTYKGRAVDVKQVGRELGVRYVLEGSVRKSGGRLRIGGQLIDAANGAHIWADRFDGTPDNVFDLQDQVTASVVGAISPKIEQADIRRAQFTQTESLVAYDHFLRGMGNSYNNTRDSVDKAMRLFSRAIELDPGFAAAYGMAAYCYVLRKASGWMNDREREAADAEQLARRAVQLGKDDAISLSRAGHALAYVVNELEAGTLFVDRALALNPNSAPAWFSSCWLRVWIGEPDVAAKHFVHFERLSPLDPLMPEAQSANAFAHFFSGYYDEASFQAEQTLQENPKLHPALRVSAAANALAGRVEYAQKVLARLRQIDPGLRVSDLKHQTPLRRLQDMAKYVEGMRKAGLPD
jgi:TolB-like protein/DNA-binding winged helix-turn-helix (wHTH) protein